MSNPIIPSSISQIRTKLASEGVPTLLYFTATWCGPCQGMAPAIAAFSQQREGLVDILKVDLDQFQEFAAEVGIRSVPTFLVVRNGETLDARSGAMSLAALSAFVDRALSN